MDLEKLRKLVNEMCDASDTPAPNSGEQQPQHKGQEEPSGSKMARTDLVTIAKESQELVNMFGDEAELPDWVESKLTKAADYISSVKRYIGGEIVRQQGGLMEAGYYKNPDRDEIDSGIGKKAMGSGGDDHENMRSKAKTQDQLSKDFLASRPGSKSPRARKMLISKYKKMGLKSIPSFDVNEVSAYDMKGEEVINNLVKIGINAIMTAKDPDRVVPKLIDYLIPDEADKAELQSDLWFELGSTLHSLKPSKSEIEEEYYHISDATYDDGSSVEESIEFWDDVIMEAEYQGRKVTLNKPMQGDVKKSKVYVKDPKTGNVKKVNFGDKKMKIKKSNPKRRKSFRARHKCKTPGPKTKARYWSCKAW